MKGKKKIRKAWTNVIPFGFMNFSFYETLGFNVKIWYEWMKISMKCSPLISNKPKWEDNPLIKNAKLSLIMIQAWIEKILKFRNTRILKLQKTKRILKRKRARDYMIKRDVEGPHNIWWMSSEISVWGSLERVTHESLANSLEAP